LSAISPSVRRRRRTFESFGEAEKAVKKIRFDGFFASDAKKMIENALFVMFFVDAPMREAE
jgi:hypothetical protein